MPELLSRNCFLREGRKKRSLEGSKKGGQENDKNSNRGTQEGKLSAKAEGRLGVTKSFFRKHIEQYKYHIWEVR